MSPPGDTPSPVDAVVARWTTDQDFATAYSYLRPGGAPADRETLAGEIAPGLRFAGEATSTAYPGTMHGAWFSGERAARAVLDAQPARAVVIGAGFAGLAAARVLHDAGVETLVLEAKAAAGGRAATDRSLGGPAHLGAAWLHGEIGNPIAEIAQDLGERTEPSRWQSTVTFVDGVGRLPPDQTSRLDAARGALWNDLDQLHGETVDEALGPTLRELIDRHSDGLSPTERIVLERSTIGIYENLYAAPVDDLSMRHREEPFRLPGHDLTLLDGIDRMVARVCDGLDVRLSTAVDRVAKRNDGWQVTTRALDLTDAATHPADAVIVTVPVGALKAGRIAFDPPLPRRITDALDRIGAGLVTKAFFAFDEAFWGSLWSFSTIGSRRFELEMWVDASHTIGRPALCAFATGERARRVEQLERDALLRLAHETLTAARVRG